MEKKKTIKIKAWFWTYKGNQKWNLPDITLTKPTKDEIKSAQKHNYNVYPCEIIYKPLA